MSELSREARALLREARAFDEPSASDVQRVHASVLAKVGIAVGIGAGMTAAAPSVAASSTAVIGATIMKLGAAIVVAGGLATASYVALRSPSSKPAAAVVTSRAPEIAVFVPPPVVSRGAERDEPPAVVSPAPTPAKPSRARPSLSHAPRPARVAADLEGEARLLEQADADLRRGDATAALRRLAEHAARYPSGALREEREGVRVVALCRAGRAAEGRAAADRFLARSPRSTLAPRIRAACGSE
jgi:hypothetical protein